MTAQWQASNKKLRKGTTNDEKVLEKKITLLEKGRSKGRPCDQKTLRTFPTACPKGVWFQDVYSGREEENILGAGNPAPFERRRPLFKWQQEKKKGGTGNIEGKCRGLEEREGRRLLHSSVGEESLCWGGRKLGGIERGVP